MAAGKWTVQGKKFFVFGTFAILGGDSAIKGAQNALSFLGIGNPGASTRFEDILLACSSFSGVFALRVCVK